MASIVAFYRIGDKAGNYNVGVLLDLNDFELAEVGVWLYDSFLSLDPREIWRKKYIYFINNVSATPQQVLRFSIINIDRESPLVINCEPTVKDITLTNLTKSNISDSFHKISLINLDAHKESMYQVKELSAKTLLILSETETFSQEGS